MIETAHINDVMIPILCPIQFVEPTDTVFYPNQELFLPKLISDKLIQIRISAAYYAGSALTIKMVGLSGVLNTFNFTKAGTTPFYYANATIDIGSTSENVYFEIYYGASLVATSLVYAINPTYQGDIKTISYTNLIGGVYVADYETFFSSTLFAMDLECGFKPNGFKPKGTKEDFSDQFENTNIVYGMPYCTEVLTLGDSSGIPNWLIQKLNAIFMCNTVQVSGTSYEVSTGASIELVDQTDIGLGVYSIELQKTQSFLQ